MPCAALPADEEERLAALHALNIVDTAADPAYDRITRIARATFRKPIAIVSLVDRNRQWFKSRLGMDALETPRSESFCAHAIHGANVMVVEDATLDARFCDNPSVTCEDGIRFYAGAPLTLSSGHRVGTLCIAGREPGEMDDAQRDLLRDMAAIVVQELELRKTAGLDGLTRLYNRRIIDDIGHSEFARSRREACPLSVAVLDLDHFKRINDTFGHAAGDAVLRAIGPVCQNALRASDMLGRYGGEEFLIILPRTTLAQARAVVERVRLDIENIMISELGGRWHVTASIGIAEIEPGDRVLGTTIARADAALYRAKQAGRNRVEFSEAA